MPIHDWTQVDPAIFHSFRLYWTSEIARAFNRGLLQADYYALPGQNIVIRHVSDHRNIAIVEIVSPGNKGNSIALDAFVENARDALSTGIHLLVIDLFPPGPSDPQGIHEAIWYEESGPASAPPPGKPLTCAAYKSEACRTAFIEFLAVGESLPKMPLFLKPDIYIEVPLEATYQSAWESMPNYWQDVLSKPA